MSAGDHGVPGIEAAEEIGRGGFGVVYRATEKELGRSVAVKLLTGEVDERTRTRFERECKAMGALSSHPHIVTIYRSGTTSEGLLYLVMEYLHGGSLIDRIKQTGEASWQDTVRIGIELAGALESAHRAGVLHRDVKPGNVMIDDLGRAKLGDFGIARLDGGPETKSAIITASVAHAPPEVIGGQRPDERSDVYSLASTLFQLVNGTAAFYRSTDESMIPLFARIAQDDVPDLRRKGTPDALARTLEQAMSKEAVQRYGSAETFGQALVAVQRELGEPQSQLWVSGGESQKAAATSTAVISPPTNSRPPAPRSGQQRTSGDLPLFAQPTPAPAPVQQFVPYRQPAPTPQPAQQHRPQQTSGPLLAQQTGGQLHQPQAASKGGIPTVARILGAVILAVIVIGVGAYLGLRWFDDSPTISVGADVQLDSDRSTGSTDASASGPTDPADTEISDGETGDTGISDGETADEATETTTTTTVAPTTLPTRPAFLADAPTLPAVEAPYSTWRLVTDSSGAYSFEVPAEWVDEVSDNATTGVAPNVEQSLGGQAVPGVFTSGNRGEGIFDPDFFLTSLLGELNDPSCEELFRSDFADDPFDGLVQGQRCFDHQALQVNLIMSTPTRDAIIFLRFQLIDERDFAAVERILESYTLIDVTQLAEA